MIENLLEGIMSNDEFQELLRANENGKDYKFNKNGLNIEIKNSKNGFKCNLEYSHPTQNEVDAFRDYCESLDDELFVSICEFIGKDGLTKIQDCLDSDNIDSVRGAVQYFRNNAKDYINSKISEYKEVLKTL